MNDVYYGEFWGTQASNQQAFNVALVVFGISMLVVAFGTFLYRIAEYDKEVIGGIIAVIGGAFAFIAFVFGLFAAGILIYFGAWPIYGWLLHIGVGLSLVTGLVWYVRR